MPLPHTPSVTTSIHHHLFNLTKHHVLPLHLRAWEHIATLIKHIISRIFHQLNVTIVAMHCLLPQRSCLRIQTTINYIIHIRTSLYMSTLLHIYSRTSKLFSKRCHETPSPTVERLYQPCQSNKDAQQRITKHNKQCMPCAHRPELVKHGGDTLISYSTVTWRKTYHMWNVARKLAMYMH